MLSLTTLTGCDSIASLLQPHATVVPLEVWNRTLHDIFLIDKDGTVLTVPACGHASAPAMNVTLIDVRTDGGRIHAFGSAGPPGPQYLVEIAAQGESFPTRERPVVLPPCAGHPVVVPSQGRGS